jgi:hypothetical protein
MSFTRFRDDAVRVAKYNQQSVFAGQYALGMPGPGIQLPFIEDPHWRLTKHGANLWSDSTNLESDLKGLGQVLSHDYDRTYDNKTLSAQSRPKSYPNSLGAQVEESRATHPAWTFRDLPTKRWETPLLNPQAHLEKPFHHNLQTRILEKDFYKPKLPTLS